MFSSIPRRRDPEPLRTEESSRRTPKQDPCFPLLTSNLSLLQNYVGALGIYQTYRIDWYCECCMRKTPFARASEREKKKSSYLSVDHIKTAFGCDRIDARIELMITIKKRTVFIIFILFFKILSLSPLSLSQKKKRFLLCLPKS